MKIFVNSYFFVFRKMLMEDNILNPNQNNQPIREDNILHHSPAMDFSSFDKIQQENEIEEVKNNPVIPQVDFKKENKEIQPFDEHQDDIQLSGESDSPRLSFGEEAGENEVFVSPKSPESEGSIQSAAEKKNDVPMEKNEEIKIIETSSPTFNLPIKEPVFYLETAKIKPNPYQPRRHFDEQSLNELAESIREFGILQPLVVSRFAKSTDWGEDVEYQLIAGERRLLASKLIGLERVPAIVKDNPDERMKLEMAIIENLQRSDLNPIEMARAFARLADEFGLPQREIAAKIGKSRESVANTIRLLQLPHEAQKALTENKVSEAHCRVILTVSNPEKQRALLAETLTFGLSVRELQSLAERFSPKAKKDSEGFSVKTARDAYLKEVEIHLAQALSLPVSINRKGEKGKIVINFATEDDFKNILNKFGVQSI